MMNHLIRTTLNILLNFLKFIFIDEAIATCSAKSCGTCGKYMIGCLFRILEFGIISAVPPIILINYKSTYSTVIAAVVSFFGMKFFTKLVEFLSQESMPSMMKTIKESNVRLEESNARLEESNKNIMLAISKLPDDMQTIVKTELASLNDTTQKISKDLYSLNDTTLKISNELDELKTDFENSIQPYVPYDSPSNGE